MDKITLTDISVYGYHGVLESEKKLGQHFLIDLEVGLDLKEAGIKDKLDLTIDYVSLSTLVKKVVREENFNLIESIAEKIAVEVLKNFPVNHVRVKVQKPYIPADDFSGKVSVEIKRERSHIIGG